MKRFVLPFVVAVAVHAAPPAFSQQGKVEVLWLNQATFRITSPGGKVIVTDPWLLPHPGLMNPLTPPQYRNLEALGKVDVLLVTHAHPDHIVDAPAIAKLNSIPLWGAGDLNMALNTLGVLPAAQLPRFAVGGTVMPAPGIKVTATHAEHSSVYVWNNPATGKPDLVLIPIGGHFGMNPADAAYALREIIKPKYAIPMHYGTNPFNRGTPQQLLEALGAAAVKVLPLKPGEKAEF